MEHEDWHLQERPLGGVAYIGEAAAGGLVAIGVQAFLTATLVSGGLLYGWAQPDDIAIILGCGGCGQFVWLFPAFIVSIWWRPGFAGGLAGGAFLGAFLGFCLACLAAVF